MIIVHAYAGPPGSGKTTLARRELTTWGSGTLVDDPGHVDLLIKALQEAVLTDCTQHIFITDPAFCREVDRLVFEKVVNDFPASTAIVWSFFEKDLDKCWKNIQYRGNNKRVSYDSLKRYVKYYDIPEGINTIKIWSPDVN